MEQLKASGFEGFNTCQSLFRMLPEKLDSETTIPGHDKGSFVAIEAIKAV